MTPFSAREYSKQEDWTWARSHT